jgi:hypothetical protein
VVHRKFVYTTTARGAILRFHKEKLTRKYIYLLSLTAALIALIGLSAQGCAKSGDDSAAGSASEPEFTITGEAI